MCEEFISQAREVCHSVLIRENYKNVNARSILTIIWICLVSAGASITVLSITTVFLYGFYSGGYASRLSKPCHKYMTD